MTKYIIREATFFGETAWARYKRLKKKEEE